MYNSIFAGLETQFKPNKVSLAMSFEDAASCTALVELTELRGEMQMIGSLMRELEEGVQLVESQGLESAEKTSFIQHLLVLGQAFDLEDDLDAGLESEISDEVGLERVRKIIKNMAKHVKERTKKFMQVFADFFRSNKTLVAKYAERLDALAVKISELPQDAVFNGGETKSKSVNLLLEGKAVNNAEYLKGLDQTEAMFKGFDTSVALILKESKNIFKLAKDVLVADSGMAELREFNKELVGLIEPLMEKAYKTYSTKDKLIKRKVKLRGKGAQGVGMMRLIRDASLAYDAHLPSKAQPGQNQLVWAVAEDKSDITIDYMNLNKASGKAAVSLLTREEALARVAKLQELVAEVQRQIDSGATSDLEDDVWKPLITAIWNQNAAWESAEIMKMAQIIDNSIWVITYGTMPKIYKDLRGLVNDNITLITASLSAHSKASAE